MHDETGPHADVPVWNPPPPAAGSETQVVPATAATFDGRTAGRASAIRGGVVLGAALVLSGGVPEQRARPPPADPSSGAGAQPSAAASQPAKGDQGKGDRGPSAF